MAPLWVCAAAALLAAAHAAGPVQIIEVTQAGKVVIPETSYAAIDEMTSGSDGVVVVGGYGTGVGLSTAFNTAMRAGQGDGLLRGFPIMTTRGHRSPSIWLTNSGLTTKEGQDILLLSCEGCFYHHNVSVSVSAVLFRFMVSASHHLVFHSVTPSEMNVNRLEYLIRQAEWAELSAPSDPDAVLAAVASGDASALDPANMVLSQHDDAAAQAKLPAAAGKPRITWAWGGIPAQKATFDKLMQKFKLEGKVKPHVLPPMFDDTHLSLLKDITRARVGDTTPGFREACVGLVVNEAAGEARGFNLARGTVYQFFKTMLQAIEANKLPTATPDLGGLMKASMNDRKMFAVGAYKDVLRLVGSGDGVWLERVVRELAAQQPNLIAGIAEGEVRGAIAASRGSSSKLLKHMGELVAAGATTDASNGAVVPPATQKQYHDAETQAWQMAFDYFTDGFSTAGPQEATTVRGEMRSELASAKESLREQHTALVKDYLSSLSAMATETVDSYIAKHELPDVCSDETEDQLFADFADGAQAMFAGAADYWPSYDAVKQAEAKAIAYIRTTHETRRTKRNQKLHEEMERGALEQLQNAKAACRLPEGSAPASHADIVTTCDAAVAAAIAGLRARADDVTPTACAEPSGWVQRTAVFKDQAAKLAGDVEELKRGVVEENTARFVKTCEAATNELYEVAVLPVFEDHESADVPDEDELAGKMLRLLQELPQKLDASMAQYTSPHYGTCRDGLLALIEREWEASKMRIEKKLFGSDEVRMWRAQWTESLDAAMDDCGLCRLHLSFTEQFLTELAQDTAPKSIGGQALGEGFRAGVIRRAVKKDMSDFTRGGDLEWVLYTTAAALVAVPLVIKVFM